MKIIRIILIFLTSFGSIQNNNGQQNKGSYYPIEKIVTLTEKSYDFSDKIYQNIGSIIKNKKIILLGDQTHLEGNVTEIKVNLIEYLHEKHNFNIILFEDSFFKLNLFDINKNKIITEKKWDEYFSHYLAGNQQFLKFINFLESEETNINNVKIGGFDSQILEQDNTILIESLISFLTQIDIQITEYEKSILEYQFAEAANYPHEGNPIKSDSEKKNLLDLLSIIKTAIDKEANTENFEGKYWSQIILNIHALFETIAKKGSNISDIEIQNLRDSLMASNFNFIKNIYPNDKIVGWGASYHFSKNLNLIKKDTITETYINQINKEQNKEKPLDYKIFSIAKPLGDYLDSIYPNEVYSLAFTTYEGEYGRSYDTDKYKIIPPPKESLEGYLMDQNKTISWIHFFESSDTPPFFLSALGHLPILSKWESIFNGIIFIPRINSLKSINFDNDSIDKEEKNRIKAQVISGKSNTPISYCNIFLEKGDIGTITNDDGWFELILDKTRNDSDSITFSAIGYQTKKILIKDIKTSIETTDKIILSQDEYFLNEVVVESTKILGADLIVKKTIQNKKSNLDENHNKLNLYYRTYHKEENETIKKIEGIVDLYSPYGYSRNYNFKQYAQNHYAEILQSINHISSKSSGIPLLQFYYFDIMSDSESMFQSKNLKKYNFELVNISSYNSDSVYVISFDKKILKHGTFNNYITSYNGKLFITVNDYALIKYEAIYSRNLSQDGNNRLQNFSVVANYQKEKKYYYLKSGKINLLDSENGKKSEVTDIFLTLKIGSERNSNLENNLFFINDKIPKFNPQFWKNHKIVEIDN